MRRLDLSKEPTRDVRTDSPADGVIAVSESFLGGQRTSADLAVGKRELSNWTTGSCPAGLDSVRRP